MHSQLIYIQLVAVLKYTSRYRQLLRQWSCTTRDADRLQVPVRIDNSHLFYISQIQSWISSPEPYIFLSSAGQVWQTGACQWRVSGMPVTRQLRVSGVSVACQWRVSDIQWHVICVSLTFSDVSVARQWHSVTCLWHSVTCHLHVSDIQWRVRCVSVTFSDVSVVCYLCVNGVLVTCQ